MKRLLQSKLVRLGPRAPGSDRVGQNARDLAAAARLYVGTVEGWIEIVERQTREPVNAAYVEELMVRRAELVTLRELLRVVGKGEK